MEKESIDNQFEDEFYREDGRKKVVKLEQ